MKPLTFKAAIQTILKGDTPLNFRLVASSSEKDVMGLNIENIEATISDIFQEMEKVKEEMEHGSILVNELRNYRQTFFAVERRLYEIEEKEVLEAINLRKNTKWHEQSKVVRLFLVSEKGEQLEQAEKEAEIAKTLAKEFSEEFTSFELSIDQSILDISAECTPDIGLLVEKWRAFGNLKDNLFLALQNIKLGEEKLESKVTCWHCLSSNVVDNSTNSRFLVQAHNQLNEQFKFLDPIYETLTEKLESKIAQVKEKLSL